MDYLAINTAVGAEILLVCGGADYYFAFPQKTMTAGLLLPAANDLLIQAGITLEALDAFVCVIGPGSFTGIRIGVSTVRALAYALNKPVVAVTYFDLLAYNSTARFGGESFTAAVDGGAGAAYLKNFDAQGSVQNNAQASPPFAVKREDIIKNSHKNIVADPFFSYQLFDDDSLFAKDNKKAGLGAQTLNFQVLQRGKDPFKAAAQSAVLQKKFMDYKDLVPLYLRRSQPERAAGEV